MDKTIIYEQYDRVIHASWSAPPTESEYKMRAQQGRNCFVDLLPADRNSRILDLGCGVGHLLYLLRECGFGDIFGVDICAGAVERARQMSLPVQQGDIFEFLETATQSFDCVIGVDVIEHLTLQQALALLGLIRSRLNPGGTVIFQTINGGSPWCQSFFASDLTHETLFTPYSLKSLLELSGFSDVLSREVVPPPNPVRHLPRYYAWKALRLVYATWNFIETGTGVSGIYSRNFILRANLPR
jgi:2-polyprenyl-3-methyl-5-hydroxy-6-metoxy-1,4-benzoquinol methylase